MKSPCLFVAVFLCVSPVAADDFFLYRNESDHLAILAESTHVISLSQLTPCWDWEGGSTHCVIERGAEGFEWSWSIDIAGPHWLYVKLKDHGDGLEVQVVHSQYGVVQAKWFNGYDDLLADNGAAAWYTKALMARLGQRPQRIEVIRGLAFGQAGKCPAGVRSRCMHFIAQLNATDWKYRDEATRELSAPALVIYLDQIVEGMKLTSEQDARIEAILRSCSVTVAPSLFPSLQRLAMSNGTWH